MNHSCDFKIVLLHEDFVSGIRGISVLERLAGQLEMESERLETEIWKFAVLRDPQTRAKAMSILRQANMIIVSAGGRTELPSHMRDLIETALGRSRGRDAAIVALLDWEQATTSSLPRVGLYLRDLAIATGMDFFCNKGAWEPAGASGHHLPNVAAPVRFGTTRETIPWNS